MVIKGVNTIGRQNTHLSLKMWFIALHFGNFKVLDVVLDGVSLKKNLEKLEATLQFIFHLSPLCKAV